MYRVSDQHAETGLQAGSVRDIEGNVTTLDVVRIALIGGNTAVFALLAASSARRAFRSRLSGSRRIRIAAAAACGAVSVGGIQRLVLQGIHSGLIAPAISDPILEGQALIQSIIVAVLGGLCWWSLRSAERDVITAEQMLAAFASGLGDIAWSDVRLTRRQTEVLSLISQGVLTDVRLAQELGVSVETVRSHVKAVLKAVGVSTRIELAVAVHQRSSANSSGDGLHP